MSFDLAVRITEVMLGIVFIQQSIEHLRISDERALFSLRLVLAIALVAGYSVPFIVGVLLILSLVILYKFKGPYNGGSDRMSLLILFCLCLVHFNSNRVWQEIAFAYLALQLILSYFISGWVKIKNRDWRNGRALRDVFQFSAYPVSESLRKWAESPRILLVMSWSVMLFELLFPLAVFSPVALLIALMISSLFHLANACLFGLNRFFWVWIASYPSIIWFQQRVF